MYLPSVVFVALMQVGGPESGEQLHAFHTPAPMPLAAVASMELTPIAEKADVSVASFESSATSESTRATSVTNKAGVHTAAKPQQMPRAAERKFDDIEQRISARAADRNSSLPVSGIDRTNIGAGSLETGRLEIPPMAYTSSSGSNSKSYSISVTEEGYREARVDFEKQVVLSAPYQGRLLRFQAPKRTRDGRDLLGPDGKPVFVEIKAGQIVRAGEIIGVIDDAVDLSRVKAAEASLEVALAEENKQIEVDFARAQYGLAYAEHIKNVEVNEKLPGAIPDIVVMESELKVTQAKKQWEKAKYDLEQLRPREREVKEQELAISQATLKQRQLISPVDGVVQQVIGQEGEWFREGDDILRIIRLEKVLVKADIDAKRLIPRSLYGRMVTVTATEVDGSKKQYEGTVIFASEEQKIDQTFEVHIEVENELEQGFWLLRPGQYVDIVIHLDKIAKMD